MPNKNSARTTLKNTGIIGGSQIATILISIVKTKAIAIILGPSGIGIIQLFTSTIALINSVFSLGIGFSGVRDISESVASGNNENVSKSIITVKRWIWFSAILGMLITLLLSKKLSVWTFGNENYWKDISLLSITIVLTNVAAGYSSIIRGHRRMADFAKISILSVLISTIIAIPIYYYFEENGIVPVLILTALITLVLNILYSKKINYPKVWVSNKESFFNGLGMLKLGLYTVFTNFITIGTLYYVRTSIGEKLGVEYVGYYAVAVALAVTYMGLIFKSMSADYFPKLSAINKDNNALNSAVLEQTKIVLMLGTPLIIAMYTFSEYLIQLLYSSEFLIALPILMWMLISVFLKLITFPIGFVFIAKSKGKIYIFTQSLWNFIFLFFVFLSWKYRGDLEGVGIAYTMAYVVGVIVNIILIKQITKFVYDYETIKYLVGFSIIILIYFYISYTYESLTSLVFKIIGLILLILYSFKKIEKLIGDDLILLFKKKLLKK